MGISRHRVIQPPDQQSGRAEAAQALEQGSTFRVMTGEGDYFVCRPRRIFDLNDGAYQVSGTLPEDVVAGRASRFTLLLSPDSSGRILIVNRPEPDFDAEFPELGFTRKES